MYKAEFSKFYLHFKNLNCFKLNTARVPSVIHPHCRKYDKSYRKYVPVPLYLLEKTDFSRSSIGVSFGKLDALLFNPKQAK